MDNEPEIELRAKPRPEMRLVPPKLEPFTLQEASEFAKPFLETWKETKREQTKMVAETEQAALKNEEKRTTRLLIAAGSVVLPLLAMAAYLFVIGRDATALALIQSAIFFAGGVGTGFTVAGRQQRSAPPPP